MGRRKPHKIKIREERLERLDETKMEVAIWLLAKGKVEDRTQRSQPSPPVNEEVKLLSLDNTDEDVLPDGQEAA